MATTFTAARAAADFPVAQSHSAGTKCQAWGTIAVAINPTAADIYKMCKIPNGATVTGGRVIAEDMDINATETLDMDVGWAANGVDAADPNGFGDLGVWVGDAIAEAKPEAGVSIAFQGILASGGPKTFAAETTIEVVCVVTAATFSAGQLTVIVDYLSP